MKTVIDHPALTSASSRRTSVALFAIAFSFWPTFMLLTLLEERAGLSWLRTGSPMRWVPIAALALLAAIVAPLFLNLSVSKKAMVSVCSLLGFALIYGVVVFTGLSFLNWGD